MKFSTTGLESYLSNEDLEARTGVWLQFPGGIRIKVLRAGGSNVKYQRVGSAVLKPYSRQISRGTLDVEVTSGLMRDIYSKAVVVDWEGVKDVEGNDVPCTPENVRDFFEAVPELFDEVVEAATRIATFSQEQSDEAGEELGN